MPNTENRIISDLPESEYHSDKSRISKHDLDAFAENPYAFFRRREPDAPPVPAEAPSAALALGSAVHCAVLEPLRYAAEFVAMPEEIKIRRGKAWEEFAAANEGKTVLKRDEEDVVVGISDALAKHKLSSLCLNAPRRETTVLWTHPEFPTVPLRSRIDFISENFAVVGDLKTTSNASEAAFVRDCDAYGYDIQAAFYIDALRVCGADPHVFAFVVVEKSYPFTPAVYTFDADADFIAAGRLEYRRRLALYAEWLEKGAENIPVGYSAHNLSLPPWSRRLKALRENDAAQRQSLKSENSSNQ